MIKSPRKIQDLSLKSSTLETIGSALKDTFPHAMDTDLESKVTIIIPSFYALKEEQAHQELFMDALNLINKVLIVSKIDFDKDDLLTPVPVIPTGWRTWFSAEAWRNWLAR